VLRRGEDVTTGKLILLHDPAGHEAWEGDTRLVCYVQAEVEDDLAGDPLLPQVTWGWLVDALDTHTAGYGRSAAPSHKPHRRSSAGYTGRPRPIWSFGRRGRPAGYPSMIIWKRGVHCSHPQRACRRWCGRDAAPPRIHMTMALRYSS
jgi:hypothetical protein